MHVDLKDSLNDKMHTFVLIIAISVICVIDVLAVRILSLLGTGYSIENSVLVFSALFAVFLVVKIIFIKLISSFTSIYKYNSKIFGSLFKALVMLPFIPSVITGIILLQLFGSQHYQIILIPIGTMASFIPAILVLSLLVYKFIRWFALRRDYMMLTYAIAISAIIFNAVVFVLNLPPSQFESDSLRTPITIQHLINNVATPERQFQGIYQYASLSSYLLIWFATSLLLYNYSRKVGKLIFWFLVSLPLIYFLMQDPHFFDFIFSTIKDHDPLLYISLVSLVFGLNKTVGGVFFAIGFWVSAKSINNKQISNYLTMSGHGILLMFVAMQANSLIISPYPPFGIIAVSSMTLATLLTFVGLYFTALSISKETTVRIEIDKKVSQLAFIKKMGSAEMEGNIYKQVLPLIDSISKFEENIPTSLEPEDVKVIVKDALDAVKERKSLH